MEDTRRTKWTPGPNVQISVFGRARVREVTGCGN
jgi:hypothetical protein